MLWHIAQLVLYLPLKWQLEDLGRTGYPKRTDVWKSSNHSSSSNMRNLTSATTIRLALLAWRMTLSTATAMHFCRWDMPVIMVFTYQTFIFFSVLDIVMYNSVIVHVKSTRLRFLEVEHLFLVQLLLQVRPVVLDFFFSLSYRHVSKYWVTLVVGGFVVFATMGCRSFTSFRHCKQQSRHMSVKENSASLVNLDLFFICWTSLKVEPARYLAVNLF